MNEFTQHMLLVGGSVVIAGVFGFWLGGRLAMRSFHKKR